MSPTVVLPLWMPEAEPGQSLDCRICSTFANSSVLNSHAQQLSMIEGISILYMQRENLDS
jgi:hypothetical protein